MALRDVHSVPLCKTFNALTSKSHRPRAVVLEIPSSSSTAMTIHSHVSTLLFLLVLVFLLISEMNSVTGDDAFPIKEGTVHDFRVAFEQNKLTSRQLVEFYLGEIRRLNPILRGVIEVNPDALLQADKADYEREVAKLPGSQMGLHGIPVLLKDNIATKDKMNTTAGSFALLESVVPRDAGVVRKLRKAGAVILGKASMSEWAGLRFIQPYGWCARTGQGRNPYVLSETPFGSSSGSAISVAANLAAVTLGTETQGSILLPSHINSVVGIKPTVGLTSRAGVVPISPRQDTVGPLCRTVADAVEVLDAIVGFDSRDKATRKASKYIPRGGYKQFLNANGLKGKRLGILRNPIFLFENGSVLSKAFEHHLHTLRQGGAILVDHLEIGNIDALVGSSITLEALEADLKEALNAYLKELVASPVRTLADVIAFNNKFPHLEKVKEYGQDLLLQAQATKGINKKTLSKLARLSRNGFERLMKKRKLDALVGYADISFVLGIGGFPGIVVPAGYDSNGVPFGICFAGLKGSEPNLIEISYSFEQATKIRKTPSFKP